MPDQPTLTTDRLTLRPFVLDDAWDVERLAGILALSTYLVQADKLPAEAGAANRDLPILMAHGTLDPVVRFEWGLASRRALEANGNPVEWHQYPIEHSLCLEEVRAIGAWLGKVLPTLR